jgi:hypothetical protein
MKSYNELPPLKQLTEMFWADPASPSGLRRKVSTSSNAMAGDIAGSQGKNGRWRVKLNRKLYLSHRIVWAITQNADPGDLHIDHIDGNPSNNDPGNLRLATRAQNIRNQVNQRMDNTSGIPGVHWRKGNQKWAAKIAINGRQLHLGCFTCKEQAAKARREAELKYFGEFAPIREQ